MRLKALLKEFLVMSKTERNGVTVLLIILAVLIVVRFTLPAFLQDNDRDIYDLETKIISLQRQRDSIINIDKVASIKNAPVRTVVKNNKEKVETEKVEFSSSKENATAQHFFEFDPNTADFNTLIEIGFSKRVAHTIINFREKGGKFYKPSDLNRIYGMDSMLVTQLLPFIKLENGYKTKKIKRDTFFNVEINSADSAMFTKLPGIGPAYASRICKFRNYLGGFVSVQQISEVYGLPEETFKQIQPLLVVDTSLIKRISLNFSDVNDFKKHPYCNYSLARKIVDYRSKQGSIKSIEQLANDSVIEITDFEKLAPYLSIN